MVSKCKISLEGIQYEIRYEYKPGIPGDYFNQGQPESIEIYNVYYEGKEIPMSYCHAIDLVEDLEEEFLETCET